jgi:hypothetical protein
MQDDFKKSAENTPGRPEADKPTNEGGIVRFDPKPHLQPPGPDQLRIDL